MSSSAPRWLRFAVLVCGILNAVLYAGLTPLWDGFDEPFHYGYLQSLRVQASLPVLGRTVLSEEVVRSLDLVPVSYRARLNVRRGVSFDAYFALTGEQRKELRSRLDQIPPRLASGRSQSPNYEAQQAPLAYAVLVPFDALWAGEPLTARILRLRLVGALLSTLLLWVATFRLALLMGAPEIVPLCAAFLTFSSQMLYATICHVDNDWLGLPLFALLLAESVALYLQPKTAGAVRLGLWLAAGLLTKAYFLSAVPFAAALVAWCCGTRKLPWRSAAAFATVVLALAGPWYGRNLILYRNLTGMQETIGGTPLGQIAAAAVHVPWPRALMATVRTSLWTGNNSLFTFNEKTVILMALLLLAGLCAYAARAVRRGLPPPERPLLAGMLCFAAGLVYGTVLTYWATRGAGISPPPWHVQPLLAPGLLLLFIPLSQSRWLGRGLAAAILWVWTYVIAATYAAKLIPFYAGLTASQARLADLPRWWRSLLGGSCGSLDTAPLLPVHALLLLTAAVIVAAAAVAAILTIILLPAPAFRRTLKV